MEDVPAANSDFETVSNTLLERFFEVSSTVVETAAQQVRASMLDDDANEGMRSGRPVANGLIKCQFCAGADSQTDPIS